MVSEAERSASFTSWALEDVLAFARDRLTCLHGNIRVLTVTQTLGVLVRSMALPYAFLYILALGGTSHQIGPVTLLTLIVILGFFSNAVASPCRVVYARDNMDLSTKSWGLVLSVEAIAQTLLSIPASAAIDRYGRTRFIRVAPVIAGVTMAAYMVATSFAQVLLIRAVTGIANAYLLAACTSTMANGLPRDVRRRATAALGRGAIPLAPSSGGTGGRGIRYLWVLPVILGSLIGGFLYGAVPRLPGW